VSPNGRWLRRMLALTRPEKPLGSDCRFRFREAPFHDQQVTVWRGVHAVTGGTENG
jgi:hypothetical protein